MAILPSTFLDQLLTDAHKRSLQSHVLPDNKGLLLFAENLSAPEQCSLLQMKIEELQAAQQTLVPEDEQIQTSQCPDQRSIDCQVTVEERAQLFKFLNDKST